MRNTRGPKLVVLKYFQHKSGASFVTFYSRGTQHGFSETPAWLAENVADDLTRGWCQRSKGNYTTRKCFWIFVNIVSLRFLRISWNFHNSFSQCLCNNYNNNNNNNKLCGRPPQYASAPASWSFDVESGVRVTCDLGYLYANFSLPRLLCSRLRPDVRDRQTVVVRHRRASSLNAPYHTGGA